jgi:KDO2-lipid IV(A) lauroyltransferase
MRVTRVLMRRLPYPTAVALGAWFGRMAYRMLRTERRKAIANLTQAFGREKSPGEIHELARAVFANAGRASVEGMFFPYWSKEFLGRWISSVNPEPALALQREGRGFVVMTGHFGNWEMMGAYAVNVLGLNLGVIARRLSNPRLDRMMNEFREQIGLKVFLRGERASNFFRHLKGGGQIAILGDQAIRRIDGIFVDFFGHPAHTASGPAELILRSRSPWFFAVLIRQPDGLSHQLYWEGPLAVPDGQDHESRVRRLVEEYNRRMEEMIRRYPAQWMWMHNRWKRKPRKSEE